MFFLCMQLKVIGRNGFEKVTIQTSKNQFLHKPHRLLTSMHTILCAWGVPRTG